MGLVVLLYLENQQTIDNEVIGKFEIMDGSPIKGCFLKCR